MPPFERNPAGVRPFTWRVLEWLFFRVPITAAALFLLAGLAVNLANVIGRYGFRRSLFWADEAMVFLVIWAIFLAGIAVTYRNAHLNIDFVPQMSSGLLRRLFRIVLALGVLVILLFVSWHSFQVVEIMARNNMRSIALDLPMKVMHFAVPFGFCYAALAILARLAITVRSGDEPAGYDQLQPG